MLSFKAHNWVIVSVVVIAVVRYVLKIISHGCLMRRHHDMDEALISGSSWNLCTADVNLAPKLDSICDRYTLVAEGQATSVRRMKQILHQTRTVELFHLHEYIMKYRNSTWDIDKEPKESGKS